MSKYTDLAMERRSRITPEGRPARNRCQAVVPVFAEDAGYDGDARMLVRRPLLIGDSFVLTGFREEEWKEKLL